MEIAYTPDGEVLKAYIAAADDVCLIQGPRGSGKSTASIYKLAINAFNSPKAKDGWRKRKSYVVRNTFDELKRTTLASWLVQFPEQKFGKVKYEKPFVHRIQLGDLDWEVTFLALDREEDAKKLLSAEISDIWFNEFREMPRRIIDDASAIVGRYPAKKDMAKDFVPYRPQIIGDTNPARVDHWFSMMSKQVPVPDNAGEDLRRQTTIPRGWRIKLQPPAMFERVNAEGDAVGYDINPEAENLKWLPPGYYERMVQGKSRSWIRVNALNRPALQNAGQAVWGMFREDAHLAKEPLEPIAGHPILIGQDFGRTPAAVMGQRVFDRWRILAELVGFGIGAKAFAGMLKRYMAERFPGYGYVIYGDPAGDRLAEADDISPYLMFQSAGLVVYPAPTNDISVRIAAVEELLNSAPEGVQRFKLSPACVRLAAAMAGDYQYAKVRGMNEATVPIKNDASHVADALQYLALGAGEGKSLLKPATMMNIPKRQPTPAVRGWGRLRAFAGRR